MVARAAGVRLLSVALHTDPSAHSQLAPPPARRGATARRRSPLGPLALAVALLTAAAFPATAQTWAEHYRKGLALEEQEAWAAALAEFEAASALKPFPARRARLADRTFVLDYDPHYHMARCLAALHRPLPALQQLKKAASARVTPRERLLALRAEIEAAGGPRAPASRGETALPPRTPTPAVGRLAVDTDPPGAAITVDGAPAGTAPLAPMAVPAGVHLLRAEARGFRAAERRVTVVPGETTDVVLPLVAAAPAPAAPAAPTATPPPTPRPTAAAATPAISAPTSPPPVRTTEPPAALRLPRALLGAALLALLASAGVLAIRRARRRRPGAAGATAPTRAVEHAATVAQAAATVGGYEVQGVLGRGGMATTYRARRPGDGQVVAIKVPHDSCLADPTFVTRFLREGALGEQLHHPRIVRVLAAGDDAGRPFLAMELIAGRTLKEELRTGGPLPVRRALEIARDVAEALDYAHAKGIVHRDLKPENVMIQTDGTVKVMDFGIARVAAQGGLTTTDVFLGTPLYAAPEMVDPKRVDHRADLYALGIVLFEMLAGTVPFVADSPYRVLEMHQNAPLPSADSLPRPVPARVWSVVVRLCEKSPAARFPTAEALLVELNRLLADFPELERGDVF